MGSEPTIFLLACLVSLGLTALIREIAPRIGLTDDPDGHRKLHGRTTPLGGGLAIYVTTAIILGTLWITAGATPISSLGNSSDLPSKLRGGYAQLPYLLLAGLVIVVVGLIDDWKGLKGKHKLLGQVLAAGVLMFGGLVIERIELFGYVISFGPFAYLVTLVWLLGAINALNLLDGIDGLATILGIILSCTIAAIAVVMTIQGANNQGVAIIAMVFTGSLLGFLRFNFPPASIFLGDSGSMLIGLVVGALAIGGSLKGPGTVLLAAPLAIWALPFFDSAAAILRRKLTGRSIYDTDRAHLHHRLLDLLGSNRKVLGWVATCCAVIAIAALVSLIRNDDRIVALTCLGMVAIFIATGIFGRAELLLVGTRLRGISRTLVSPILPRRDTVWQTSIPLQGNEPWDLLWVTLIESADKLQLIKIRLDVNIPTMSEAYHAAWEQPSHAAGGCRWHIEIPLVLHDRSVGLVQVTGQHDQQSACSDIEQLMELIEPFNAKLQTIATQDEAPTPSIDDEAITTLSHDGVDSPTDRYPK